jgi:two-component system response regulator AtoC
VAVNCAALPDTLLESELFGHKAGAFTDAKRDKPGRFATADGGTIFLDEIGDLTLSAQSKLLRVLQEREVKRIGENEVRRVDARVIAATHRDLRAMAAEGAFREDLFYRLDVISIDLPPLRERDNDALLLAEHFLKYYAEKFSRNVAGLSAKTRRIIASYSWPGNVRELQNAIERAVILADGPTIEPSLLPDKVAGSGVDGVFEDDDSGALSESHLFRNWRRELVQIEDDEERVRRALQLTSGNKGKAARLLGLGRTTLWRRMKQYGLTDDA